VREPSRPRAARSAIALRVAAGCIAVVALLDPSVSRAPASRPPLRLVDVSESVGSAPPDARGAAGGDVVAFADGVRSVLPGEDPLGLPRGGTRLATALAAAGARLGAEPGVVWLVTDGRSTEAGALEAAAALAEAGHRVFVSAPSRPAADVGVLEASAETVAETKTAVRVRLSSSVAGRVRVRLVRDGRAVASAEVDVVPGDGGAATLRDDDAPRESASYEVGVSPAPGTPNDDPENDRVAVAVHRGGTALVLGTWARAVDGPATVDDRVGVRVVDVLRPSDLDLADVLVVSDVPWDRIGRPGADAIGRFTAAGGRVLALGGPSSYAAGNWKGTAFESLLPLVSRPDDGGGLAFVLAIDRSGSTGEGRPGGVPPLASLQAAALRVVDALAPSESVLVLPFAESADSPAPPGWVAADDEPGRRALAGAVRGLAASGGTRLDLAVVAAAERLRGHAAKSKRVFLLTDGDPDRPPAPASFEAAARALTAAGAEFGALVVGDARAAQALREGLRAAPEEVVVLDDAKEFPDALFRALGRARGKDEARTGPFVVRPARGRLDGASLEGVVAARALDLVAAPGADVFADGEGGGRRLAFAGSLPRGAGRVVGLAWGPAFEAEAERAAACARLLPLVGRLVAESDRGLAGRIESARLVVAAGAAHAGRGRAWARRGTSSASTMLLETRSGVFEGPAPGGPHDGAPVFFEVEAPDGAPGEGGARVRRPIRLPARPGEEHRGSGVDAAALAAIARAGGGRVLAAGESPPAQAVARSTSLAPFLLTAALALLVVERALVARRPRAASSGSSRAAEAA
jgi:hypothetical protein